jgi:hypothetical protein
MKCLNLNARQENTKQVIFLEFSQKNYVVSNKRGFCKDQNNIFTSQFYFSKTRKHFLNNITVQIVSKPKSASFSSEFEFFGRGAAEA